MENITKFILNNRKKVISLFIILTIISAICSLFVDVDYDLKDYLPDEAKSTKALDIMKNEYDTEIPNMRVMIKNVNIADALEYKNKLSKIKGVEEITWLDDEVDIYEPLEMMDQRTVKEWYKDKNALFSLTVDENSNTIDDIREIIGDKNSMSGPAVTDSLSPIHTAKDIQKIMFIVIPIVLVILFLTTDSYFEPILFMTTIGIAIMLNRGSNLIFGTISFVTNAAGSILQLAVSMDYSIFLLHRFAENRKKEDDIKTAMAKSVKESVSSILSSGLTTATGFAALILMRFKLGPDMGWVMTKSIVFSLICVLILLPALSVSFYRLIDKTKHKSIIPSFEKTSEIIVNIKKYLTIAIFIILVVPSFFAQSKNKFLFGASQIYSTEQTQMGRDLIAIDKEFGSSNPIVIMVKKGDAKKEKQLNDALKKNKHVTSLLSYPEIVGLQIPQGFVPENDRKQLYSKDFSRYVLKLDVEESDDNWVDVVDEIYDIAKKYYKDGDYHIAGDLVSTADLKYTITADNTRVNILSFLFVFIVLILTFKSISIPIILTLAIKSAIWFNLAIPYFQSTTLHYISYLIINSVQLGATIDYAILFTQRYIEYRVKENKHRAIKNAFKTSILSILTSSSILALSGIVMGFISTNLVLAQLGTLIGRGALVSLFIVSIILPSLIVIFDKFIEKGSKGLKFYE
ncbi:MAG: MMPL family transporter [Tissierellia bacterium]|nr:MMPL family transporter [Tissierellia bacterium]